MVLVIKGKNLVKKQKKDKSSSKWEKIIGRNQEKTKYAYGKIMERWYSKEEV